MGGVSFSLAFSLSHTHTHTHSLLYALQAMEHRAPANAPVQKKPDINKVGESDGQKSNKQTKRTPPPAHGKSDPKKQRKHQDKHENEEEEVALFPCALFKHGRGESEGLELRGNREGQGPRTSSTR